MEYRIIRNKGDGFEAQQREGSGLLGFLWSECTQENPDEPSGRKRRNGNSHRTIEAAEKYITHISTLKEDVPAGKVVKVISAASNGVVKQAVFDPKRLIAIDDANWKRLHEASPASFWLQPAWHTDPDKKSEGVNENSDPLMNVLEKTKAKAEARAMQHDVNTKKKKSSYVRHIGAADVW